MTAKVAYLLDANVISEMMRPQPVKAVADCLDRLAVEGLGIASVTVWEILNGIGLLPEGRRRKALADQFEKLLGDYFDDAVLDWTVSDAAACAAVMEEKRRRGEPLDDHLPDAFLAGLALNRKLAVITRNESEFRNSGVEMVNPWKSEGE